MPIHRFSKSVHVQRNCDIKSTQMYKYLINTANANKN